MSANKGKQMAKASESDKSLKDTLKSVRQMFGDTAIMKLGESRVGPIEGIKTGSLTLDIALGGYGMPRGRIIEIFGPESSGKTTIALHVVAEAQKAGGVAAFIDAEHALDPSWARRLGVNVDELLISQPGSAEEALQIAEMLVRSDAIDIIVIDSVAALVPKAELEGDMGDLHVGLQARLMSQALRKLTGILGKTRTVLIFINQIRMKIGVMYGSPETTPGGNSLKFYASVRMDIRRSSTIKEGENVIGSRVKVKVVKNKVAPPFRQAEFDLMHTNGISRDGELFDLAVEEKIIAKHGAWFSFGEIKLGQGREKSRVFINDNPEMRDEIERKVMEKVLLNNTAPSRSEHEAESEEEEFEPEE